MVELGEFSLDRMVRAVHKVRERLERSTNALNQRQVPYAVAGACAVAAWVSCVDEAAVRNTQDVDILIRREDLQRVTAALETAGFVHKQVEGKVLFLDGADVHPRHSVTIHFANEPYRQNRGLCPEISEVDNSGDFSLLPLQTVVEMELGSGRITGRVNVRDLIDVGLVDQSWTARVPADLTSTLQELLENPDR